MDDTNNIQLIPYFLCFEFSEIPVLDFKFRYYLSQTSQSLVIGDNL